MGRDYTDPSYGTFDEDKDLDEVWPQVTQQYERITKQKLDSKTTFAAFQIQIEQDIQRSTSKSHQHARKVLNNIGNCLETFGNIIVQGASIVFGPASQCWNAISFVIQAARKFGDVLDGFVTLMERSAAFIRRLNFFLQEERDRSGSRLPNHLRKPAYAILSQFLGVLQSSYSLATSKRERIKTMVGVLLFNSDAGVAESLSLMESQIQDFTNAQVDQILVDVKGLARYLRESDEERNRHQSEIQEHLEAIYKVGEQVLSVTQQMKATIDGRTTKDQHNDDKIKIGKSLAFQKLGEQEPWDKRHNEICKVRVKGTGKWLERVDGFSKWADISQNEGKVFFLKADSGFGKTHISNYIISSLQEKYRAGTGPNQAYLAYYYYGDDKDESLERCIGSIIYQFAAVDVGYASAVANACGRSASIVRAEDRWNNLVIGLESHMKGTYFICIDGFDGRSQLDNAEDTLSAIVQRAMSHTDSGVSIRFFMSGSSEALSKITQDIEGIESIVLGRQDNHDQVTAQVSDKVYDELQRTRLLNASDLEAVIRARIIEVCKVKPDLKAILSEPNIKMLVEGIRGNYNHLEAKITEIYACDTVKKVQDVINNTSDDIKTVQRNNLKALNASLNSNQILKLNELLVWVAGMRDSATIKFLQSALYFTFRENFLLESEIITTYSPLLKIDEYGGVVFRSDESVKILTTSDAESPDTAPTSLHIEEISRAEIDLCRRFIKNACDAVDYARFRFDEFFDAMAYKANICLDDENVLNLTVLSLCLKVLCAAEKNENLDKLREYASIWFYEHLKTLVENLGSFEPNRKALADIGRMIVDLFYEPELIDAWFSGTSLRVLEYDWLYRDDFIDPLLKFLKNTHVAKGYAKDAKKSIWAKAVVADSANKTLILARVAAHLAGRWFSCTTIEDNNYLWVSYGIVAKVRHSFHGGLKQTDRAEQGAGILDKTADNTPSLAEAEYFIMWAKTHVDLEIDDHAWAFRVGATHNTFGHYKEAVAAFEEAEPHFQSDWALILGLARAHEQLKNFRASLEYIQKFRSLRHQFIETDKDYQIAYWEMFLAEGNCYRRCQDYNAAAKCFQAILEQDVGTDPELENVHVDALSDLFTTWTEAKSYRSIIDFMQGWKDTEAENRGPTHWLAKTLQAYKLHGSIIIAAKHSEAVEEICPMYQEAIDYTMSNTSTGNEQSNGFDADAQGHLRYFQAALKFHGSRSHQDHDQAIELWEDIIRRCDDPSISFWTAYQASRRLALCLLDKALPANEAALPDPEKYISKLEALAKMNNTVVRDSRQGQSDPRLCLTRLYYLRGDHLSAFAEAQARLCSVFDKWPEDMKDESVRIRFANLAQTLTVLDKDVDAIAAWQAIPPYEPQKPCASEKSATIALNPADLSSGPSLLDPFPVVVVQTAGEGQRVSVSINTKPQAYIKSYICDGGCGTIWNDMLADCWVCKNCLCVQLCPACYQKLRTDELDPLVCDKNHKFLYLPVFNKDLWQETPADMMIVDNQPVPRLEWVNRIRDEYKVQKEQIDTLKIEKARELKAATSIATQILRWRRRLLKIQAEKKSTVPTLRRSRTVA